ncbi:MAG: anti-sigma-I factor RsgI family protein [Syntrophomonadaceae bacterium]
MAGKEGLVVESGKDWAIVLVPGGQYKKIKTKEHLPVGSLHRVSSGLPIKYLAAAAVFLLIIVGTVDYYRVTAFARVSSGLELGFNRWDRVVKVNALSDQGQSIIEQLNVQGKPIERAVEEVIEKVVNTSSQTDELKDIKISIEPAQQEKPGNNRGQLLVEKMDKKLDRLRGNGHSFEVHGQQFIVKPNNSSEAKEKGDNNHNEWEKQTKQDEKMPFSRTPNGNKSGKNIKDGDKKSTGNSPAGEDRDNPKSTGYSKSRKDKDNTKLEDYLQLWRDNKKPKNHPPAEDKENRKSSRKTNENNGRDVPQNGENDNNNRWSKDKQNDGKGQDDHADQARSQPNGNKRS